MHPQKTGDFDSMYAAVCDFFRRLGPTGNSQLGTGRSGPPELRSDRRIPSRGHSPRYVVDVELVTEVVGDELADRLKDAAEEDKPRCYYRGAEPTGPKPASA